MLLKNYYFAGQSNPHQKMLSPLKWLEVRSNLVTSEPAACCSVPAFVTPSNQLISMPIWKEPELSTVDDLINNIDIIFDYNPLSGVYYKFNFVRNPPKILLTCNYHHGLPAGVPITADTDDVPTIVRLGTLYRFQPSSAIPGSITTSKTPPPDISWYEILPTNSRVLLEFGPEINLLITDPINSLPQPASRFLLVSPIGKLSNPHYVPIYKCACTLYHEPS